MPKIQTWRYFIAFVLAFSIHIGQDVFASRLLHDTNQNNEDRTAWTPVVAVVNATAISNTPDYILAECTSGLSNRLRVLAAYMYVAEFKFNAKLAFIWDVNSACPGNFHPTYELVVRTTYCLAMQSVHHCTSTLPYTNDHRVIIACKILPIDSSA